MYWQYIILRRNYKLFSIDWLIAGPFPVSASCEWPLLSAPSSLLSSSGSVCCCLEHSGNEYRRAGPNTPTSVAPSGAAMMIVSTTNVRTMDPLHLSWGDPLCEAMSATIPPRAAWTVALGSQHIQANTVCRHDDLIASAMSATIVNLAVRPQMMSTRAWPVHSTKRKTLGQMHQAYISACVLISLFCRMAVSGKACNIASM